MVTDLWVDDERRPPSFSDCGLHWTWAKNYDQSIEALKSGTVEFVSLDHDLCDAHYFEFFLAQSEGRPIDTSNCKEKTGYDVLLWMAENNVWPKEGIRVHTMNTVRKPIMLEIIEKHYGRTFQYQYLGTHSV